MSRARLAVGSGVEPEFKLWLSCPGSRCVFGLGKWRLLDAIHSLGSLRAAADSIGISYRKAWGDLRAAEKALGITFLDRRRGGNAGGETCLTETGLMWLREFRHMHAEVDKSVQEAFAEWNKRVSAMHKHKAGRGD